MGVLGAVFGAARVGFGFDGSCPMRTDIYGIRVGKLTVYWTKPWAVWWGEKIIWSNGWW